MSNVLTLIELSGTGAIRNTAAALIAAAAKLGTPVAVVAAKPGAGAALAAELGTLGAAQVYVAESDQVGTLLVAPEVEALVAAHAALDPAAILLAHSVEGRDVAARLAVRIGGGLLVDAVDVRADAGRIVATHSVFGGAYTVEAAVEGGTPIVTVRPGAIPSTLTSTTGSPAARKASARRAARATTSAAACGTVCALAMPFCRSTTTRAVRGSSMVMGMGIPQLSAMRLSSAMPRASSACSAALK